ncbi:MAG: outer membrane lipoprotein carrier protein LolA [Thermodesulfobacteriota bacterium]
MNGPGSQARRPQRPAPFWGLFLLLPFLLAWEGSWDGFGEASRRIDTLEARFVQKKTVPILAAPLLSQGRFFYRSPSQLRWEYDHPVRSVLMINRGAVKRYLREGERWREDSSAALPVMRVIMEEILNWHQGRFDASPHFQASLQTEPEPLVLLVPREASWKKMIRRIELEPSREQAGVMKSVRMVEDERTFTLLEFQGVRINRPLPDGLFRAVE